MARTAAGKGLSIEILGATTLEGCKWEAHSGTQWPLPFFGHFVWFLSPNVSQCLLPTLACLQRKGLSTSAGKPERDTGLLAFRSTTSAKMVQKAHLVSPFSPPRELFPSIEWTVKLIPSSCRRWPVEEDGDGELFPAVLPTPGTNPGLPLPPALHLQEQHFLGDWNPDKRNKYSKRCSASIPLSFHLSLLPPLGLPLLNIKLDPAESAFQFSVSKTWISRELG